MAIAELSLILQDITEHLTQLVRTLESEHLALVDNDLDAIIQAASDKNRSFELLEDLEKERHALLLAAGLDFDRNGIMAYLQRGTPRTRSETATLWQQIETLTHRCRKQNQINGIMLEKNRRRTEKALAILKGQTPQTATYTASGETCHTQPRHSLAKA
ncbi:MAG TPA: flagellar protein FlgN [Gammaproteobacteria bacterium]|nr:flagellar protein FlgN [Gammaproteobacteria bacterium]